MKYRVLETDNIKCIRSDDYNYNFDKDTGFFVRWGKTKDDDPLFSPIGPEILDMEISTICNLKCKACYKSNTDVGKNMSLKSVKIILGKFGKSLCQVAYGIGSVKGNPELWDILSYTREQGIIPNITVNGHDIDDDEIEKLANVCGAVSVSHYNNNDCYGTVERLVRAKQLPGATLRQVNIHQLYCLESLSGCKKVINDAKNDKRLNGLNAIVFMTLKPRGKRNNLTPVDSLDKFKDLFKLAVDNGIQIGMDSCAAPQAFKATESLNMVDVAQSIEACESYGLFSCYCNVEGTYFPCSFAEGIGNWKEGLSILDCSDFVKDIWYHPKLNMWRRKSLGMSSVCNCKFSGECRPCPLFDITPCFNLKE